MLGIMGNIIFLLLLVACFFLIFLSLPGNILILALSLIYGYLTGFEEITGRMFLLLGLLTLAGEVVEYVLGVAGAKRYGASNRGIVFSMIGGFAGAVLCAPLLLGFGAIIGALGGAFAGAVFAELGIHGPGQWRQAVRSGWGSFLGRMAGMITKSAIGLGMIVWIAASIL